jgi:hypothetical protein
MAGDPWKRRFEGVVLGVVVLIGEGYGDDGGKVARDGEDETQMTESEDRAEDIRKFVW